MRRFPRRFVPALAAVVLLLSACGDGGITEPKPPAFPEVAGVYDYSAPINELQGARLTGTITITDDSRETPGFGGSFSWNLVDASNTSYGSGSGALANAKVSESGQIEMDFGNPDFHVSGTISGRTISGTWFLRASDNYSGTITASRR